MAGWLAGWMDAWMDGWTDGPIYMYVHVSNELRINQNQLDTRHKESWNLHPLKTSGLVWGLGISVFLGYTSILQQSGPTVEKIHGLCCSCSPPWQAKPADGLPSIAG